MKTQYMRNYWQEPVIRIEQVPATSVRAKLSKIRKDEKRFAGRCLWAWVIGLIVLATLFILYVYDNHVFVHSLPK